MSQPYFGPVVTQPDALVVIRSYLLATPEVTSLCPRIATVVPAGGPWPFLRVAVLNTYEEFPRRVFRAMAQLDAYGPPDAPGGPQQAGLVARAAWGALEASAAWVGQGAVITGADGMSLSYMPDDGFTPPLPRWLVTGYVYMRPDP